MPKKSKKFLVPRPLEKQTEGYWRLLNMVIDPEMDIGIVDLGLIYEVKITKGIARVTMTLTSMGCPAGPEIMRRVEVEMGKYEDVNDVKVDLVWEPVWGPDRIREDIREILFTGLT